MHKTSTRRGVVLGGGAAVAVGMVSGQGSSAAAQGLTSLRVMTFAGLTNFPIFAAQHKGLFAKHGIAIELLYTPNSRTQREGLAKGDHQIIQTAADNPVAMVEVAKADAKEWIDPNLPVIVAHPFGHLNSFYQGIGEDEVLQVIDEVQRQFSVDPDRIFIMGHSMGGAGSFTVGLHYPDRFGSITPIDAAMWSPEDGEPALPEWARSQAAAVQPPKLYANARATSPCISKTPARASRKPPRSSAMGSSAREDFPRWNRSPGCRITSRRRCPTRCSWGRPRSSRSIANRPR